MEVAGGRLGATPVQYTGGLSTPGGMTPSLGTGRHPFMQGTNPQDPMAGEGNQSLYSVTDLLERRGMILGA